MALGLFAALTAQAAVVYRWVDADGVVHYSDQAVPGAEKIITAGGSTNNSAPTPPAANVNGPQARTNTPAPATITITSPSPEQQFFNDDTINVALSQLMLNADQSVTWHLNGRELTDQTPSTTQFVLPNPGRGIFVIAAIITNQTTGDVQTTPSVTFYVHEPSLLSPQHRNP